MRGNDTITIRRDIRNEDGLGGFHELLILMNEIDFSFGFV